MRTGIESYEAQHLSRRERTHAHAQIDHEFAAAEFASVPVVIGVRLGGGGGHGEWTG